MATVTGRVTDENNEVVPGATVTVTNESTGFSTGTLTSVDGEYTLRQIPLGSPYTIRVSFVGYKTETIPGSGSASDPTASTETL